MNVISMMKNKKAVRNIYMHLTVNWLIASLLIVLALFIGMLGYHVYGQMSWIDAFVNASMILSGMGPVSPLTTDSGKLFAGCYALFSGLAFLMIVVIILSPVIHRFFRKVHLEYNNDE